MWDDSERERMAVVQTAALATRQVGECVNEHVGPYMYEQFVMEGMQRTSGHGLTTAEERYQTRTTPVRQIQ